MTISFLAPMTSPSTGPDNVTAEERRKRRAHHVVHDYANLVSSGLLRNPSYIAQLLKIPTANSHTWHAFYANCRKMFEFFVYDPNRRYLRAQDFIGQKLPYVFRHWTYDVQRHMEGHLLHVGGDRLENELVWTGADDQQYLTDFQNAWKALLIHLKPEHRDVFRDEINLRLTETEFEICGTLDKEFIPL
jgi:hypothetical protein